MAESIGLISRITVSATVTAGLKCAPETRASVWISMNSTNTCTRAITDQSTNGCGVPAGAGGWRNRQSATVTKNTRAKVPMNSAMYAEVPLSGGTGTVVVLAVVVSSAT